MEIYLQKHKHTYKPSVDSTQKTSASRVRDDSMSLF